MAEQVEFKNASKESVALEMAKRIRRYSVSDNAGNPNPNYRQEFLDLYAECLHATTGLRDFED